jgi:hypothetical protein
VQRDDGCADVSKDGEVKQRSFRRLRERGVEDDNGALKDSGAAHGRCGRCRAHMSVWVSIYWGRSFGSVTP